MKFNWIRLYSTLLFILILFSSGTADPSHASETNPKKILVLCSYHQGHPWTDNIVHGIVSTFNSSAMNFDIRIEYMDTKRHSPQNAFDYLENLYRQKYSQTKFDMILVSDNNALDFLLPRRNELFPDTPVVFCGINNFNKKMLLGQADITGIPEDIDIRGTIRLAAKILPDIKKIIVINDNTTTGRANRVKFKSAISNLPDTKLSFELWDDITAKDLKNGLASLPQNSAVLILTFFQDKNGQLFSTPEYYSLILKNTKVPVFSLWANSLGTGVLGGVMVDGREQGRQCAEYGIHILKGAPVDTLSILSKSPNIPFIDYNILKKFGILKKDLPQKAVIMFKPESIFTKYQKTMTAFYIAFVILITLIIALSVISLNYRKTKKTLENNEALLAASQKLTKLGSWEYDIEKKKIFWTKELYSIYGMEPGQIEPGSLDHQKQSFRLYDPEVIPLMKSTIAQCIKKGKGYDLELPLTNLKGQNLWVRSTGEVIKKNDRSMKIIGCIMDITERKRMQEQIQQAQKIESIGNLAGGIAHDFNNILFPIIGLSEMLLEDLPPDGTEYDSIQEILKAAKRGSDLVRQILTFSRQSIHKMIPVEFQKILGEVTRLCRSTIPSSIKIDQDIQHNCGKIMADPSRLHQVVMNLITNAYHAVAPTDGKILIRLQETVLNKENISGTALKPGKYAMLTISDTGHGMKPDIVDKIFDPYFTTKEQGKGTGLGLAVAYGIIKEHGGDIDVYSEAEKGTVFHVYLPINIIPIEQTQDEAIKAHPTGNERILLVDDEKAIVDLIKQILERIGYKITPHTNSIDALNDFKTTPENYDLIISDMTMPNMKGDELAKKILAIRKDMPIIICTGFSEQMNEQKAQDIGVKGFLMKPVIKSEIALMIRKVLDENKTPAQ